MKIGKTSLMKTLFVATVAVLPLFAFAEKEAPAPDKPKGEAKGEGKRERPPGVFGEIVAIDAKSIQVKSRKTNEITTVNLSDTTVFGTKEAPKQASDFKVGDVVMVGYQKGDDGSLTAKRVMVPEKRPEGGKDGEGKRRKPEGADAK